MTWKTLLPVGVAWAALAGPALAGHNPVGVLATPLPPGPGTYVPDAGPLAAPVINAVGVTKHGRQLYDVFPAGWGKKAHRTDDPGRRLFDDACRTPADECFGWVDLEFLFWGTRATAPPPLLTVGPATTGLAAVPPGVAGAPGQPTTEAFFGGFGTLTQFRPGFRVEAGMWKDEHAEEAVFARFVMLGSASEGRSAGAFGQAGLAAPGRAPGGTVLLGYPGLAQGVADASIQTDLYAADFNMQGCLCDRGSCRLDLLGGFRYVYLGDRLDRSFATTAQPGNPDAGRQTFGEDSFRTRNDFYGPQVGLGFGHRSGPFSVRARGLVALGVTVSDLDGSMTRTAVGGGLPLAHGAPSSRNTSEYFAVVPEIGVKLGWQPCDHLRFTVGYDWLYWSRVRRAADAYAYTVGPDVRNAGTDVWAQGVNVGVELRY